MNRKARIISFLLLSAISATLSGQTTIRGSVIDQQNNLVAGANIYLEGTYDGTSSDANGSFSFSTSLTGPAVLKASFIGYLDYRQEVQLGGEPIQLEIPLVEAINQMKTITITAGSFESGTGRKGEVLRPLDIVTTAGATADIAGALNTLPGTQTVGEEGRLFVRGGDGYETTTFIDGMVVPESYSPRAPNIPTRSRFSPFMFSGASFSTGGYSAEYGQGLSSALILKTKEVATETRTDFSLISVGLEAIHSQVWEEASLAGKIGYFNLDPYFHLIKQDYDWINPPTSVDGNLAYRQRVGNNGMFKSYGNFSLSDMSLHRDLFGPSPESTRMRMQNQYSYLNASYSDVWSEKWTFRSGISYAYSNDDNKLDNDQLNENTQGLHFKAVGGYDHHDRVFFRLGGELISRTHHQDFEDDESGFKNRFEFSEYILAPFLEAKVYLSKSFLARLGGRIEYNSLNEVLSVDPRISFAAKTGDNSQFSLAYGHFRQSVPKDLLRIATDLESEKATHFIINYQWIKNKRTFRVETYWKEYHDLATFDASLPYRAEFFHNSGGGFARGMDLFFRDAQSIQNADFWISYSFLDTEREYRDYPSPAAPTFTSKHNFSFVYKHFIPALRSQVGFNYSFASGRPYHDPNKELFNGQRTSAYHDLSANISYLAKSNIIIHASLSNILNRENIFGYEFRPEPNDEGIFERRAITLPAPRFLLLGVFITLSKSGAVNQLPHL